MKFQQPDKSVWPDSDPRKTMDEFDPVFFRDHYNKRMAVEQPALTKKQCSLNFFDTIFVNAVEKLLVHNSMLDIGCGNARVSLNMVSCGSVDNLIGIDISDVMIERATETAINIGVSDRVTFLRTMIEDFIPKRQFDVIYATEVIEHIFHLRSVLEQISLWLTDDGIFGGITPYLNTCDSKPVHFHFFTVEDLRLLLQDFFDDVSVIKVDINGKLEFHLIFQCLKPKRR